MPVSVEMEGSVIVIAVRGSYTSDELRQAGGEALHRDDVTHPARVLFAGRIQSAGCPGIPEPPMIPAQVIFRRPIR